MTSSFQVQMAGFGFSMVEVLAACPTNLHLKPVDALAWVRDQMVPYFPLGDFKVAEGG